MGHSGWDLTIGALNKAKIQYEADAHDEFGMILKSVGGVQSNDWYWLVNVWNGISWEASDVGLSSISADGGALHLAIASSKEVRTIPPPPNE